MITDRDDESELERLGARVAESIYSKPITLGDGTAVSVGLTIGAAAHRPADGTSIDIVLDRADQAMYDKRRHRSQPLQ